MKEKLSCVLMASNKVSFLKDQWSFFFSLGRRFGFYSSICPLLRWYDNVSNKEIEWKCFFYINTLNNVRKYVSAYIVINLSINDIDDNIDNKYVY